MTYFFIFDFDREFLSDCVQGQIITAVVVFVFVAAYLFREWVIQNTATPQTQPPQPDVIEQDNRNQINARLEELRRELERRRNNVNANVHNDTLEYNNPYTANVVGQYQINPHDDDDDDYNYIFNMNPPSGTQSPFASWRDYQQQDTSSSQLRHEVSTVEDQETSQTTGTWRASEFGESTNNNFERPDYFTEQVLNEAVMDEDIEEERAEVIPTVNPPLPVMDEQPPPENDVEEPFDFVENMDGILEAIGIRGNLLLLFQNSILMALMINLCLCVTVWIPYVIGRSVILVIR